MVNSINSKRRTLGLLAGLGLLSVFLSTSVSAELNDARQHLRIGYQMQEYADLGIETFILSGYPHLEESYHFAELVFPLLPGKQCEQDARHSLTDLFGEIVGNVHYPKKVAHG